ncbi:MFS transporter [Burkholderia lata]|uniref:MFS transporter n=1 Tax=Burkholderia lata (strain ATCC 17760 / DSM 23089 / LMG 22485 / NCIMB 9086 / R18194 / 383) TaxID=482957 RepID=UPI001453561D|nr:MFS transporter [Burkholderia lata]VWB87057.1 major facilitator transporter [Burkholderia lata]
MLQLKDPVVAADAIVEGAPERNIRLTGQRITGWFIFRYVTALIGIYVALVTPASVTLALRVGQIDPVGKTASLAIVSSLGAAAALFFNPIFGALSDRSTSRWGQRRPFIIGGVLVGSLAVIAIGFAPTIAFVALGWALAQAGFNAALSSVIAILPERIPAELRGRVSGFMGMAAQVGVVGGTFLIQMVGTRGAAMFLMPTLLGGLMALPFILTLREAPKRRGEVPPIRLADIFGALWINPFHHVDFGLVWVGRFLAWTSLYLLTTYKTYFLIDRLGYTTHTVAPVLTIAMFVLAVAVAISSIGGGWLSDMVGRRKPFVILASVFFTVAMAVVALSTTVTGFLIGIAIAGLGNGLYFGVDYALVSEVLPDKDDAAGKGMGVFNMSSTIPQTLAPLLAPLLLLIAAESGKPNYTSLYFFAAAIAMVSAIFIMFIRGSK